jgi:hypothetical protein
MTTWQVTCTQCGKEKWPTAEFRPTGYVCALCVAVGAAKGAERRETGKRAAQARRASPRASQDRPGGAR